jgi:hypothetical protein
MSKLSISFTLSKASTPSGGINLEHNSRETIADNVDMNRIKDNVVYVEQDVRDAYDELFSEALETYNAKQKKPCRRIDDYYEHIIESAREEAYYEVVVQFGCDKTAGVGTYDGDIAKEMLSDYMRGFRQRNKNLHVFSATLHADEATNHIHIDFIPFTTKPSKYGLEKRVSMKSALDEQGFTAKNFKQNRLVAWEDSEREVMTEILTRYGLDRDVKNNKNKHLQTDEFKRQQDLERLDKLFAARSHDNELDLHELEWQVATLEVENAKLISERSSPWKSFYFSSQEKQEYVTHELDRLKIPYRSVENGFHAQETYVNEIRLIEKEFKPKENPHREELRNKLDKIIMQSKSFDEVLRRLGDSDYNVRHGKSVAVKPKYSSRFIRLNSLGEGYTEDNIRNRVLGKLHYEHNLDSRIDSLSENLNPDSLMLLTTKTIREYTIVFAQGRLPVRRKDKKFKFSWTNDAELDKLSELNRKINSGATIVTLRNDYAKWEKHIADHEDRIDDLKEAVTPDRNEIDRLEKFLIEERVRFAEVSEMLVAFEKIVAGTYVKSLVDVANEKKVADVIGGGLKSADTGEYKLPEPVVQPYRSSGRK